MSHDNIPLTPAMRVSDFIDYWLCEPEDLEVFIGDETFETPKELGDHLILMAIQLVKDEQRNFAIAGGFYEGRTVGIALMMAIHELREIDAELLGRELWPEYTEGQQHG